MPPEERIAKLMANRGLCSRREAERLIEQGLVSVNGAVVREQGSKASPDADIRVAPHGQAQLAEQVTIVLHKPVGIVSTQPEAGQTPAWKLVVAANLQGGAGEEVLARALSEPWTLAVAGRLDRASRGLLLMTQDGSIARRVIGGQGVEKCYLVRTEAPATDLQIRKLCGPLRLDDEPLQPMRVERVDELTLRFVLVEGKKHQIRRLCRRFGLEVGDLYRIAIGPVRLGDLRAGKWRIVQPRELEALRNDGRVAPERRTAAPRDERQRRRPTAAKRPSADRST